MALINTEFDLLRIYWKVSYASVNFQNKLYMIENIVILEEEKFELIKNVQSKPSIDWNKKISVSIHLETGSRFSSILKNSSIIKNVFKNTFTSIITSLSE